MSVTAPPLSESCDRDDHGACFPDEPSCCGCDCHPLDDVAGSTPQPGTRHVPTPKRTAEPSPVAQGRAARTASPAIEAAGPPDPSLLAPARDGGSGLSSSPPFECEAGARASVPGPGANRQSGAIAPGPGRPQAPAGGEPSGTSSSLAGSRTYTIALPPGLALLSLNDRGHWAARYRRSEALKKAAWAMALSQRIPRLERVSVTVEYQPRDLRRRDGDNIAASAKALIDGIRAAGMLPEDDSRHVTEVTCRIGSLYPKGRLVLTLTEVPGGADAA